MGLSDMGSSDMGISIRQVRDLDKSLVVDFAKRTWGEDEAGAVTSKWWLNTGHAEVIAAYDEKSDRIAGMVVGVPSFWPVSDGSQQRTISICGWYVAPEYAGRGLGQYLVHSFEEDAPCLNTFSISEAAAKSFRKMGWAGPYVSQLLLLPFPGLRYGKGTGNRFSLKTYTVQGPQLPADLCIALDALEEGRPADSIRRRRSARDWQAHLGVRSSRSYTFAVLFDGDSPVASFVVRATDSEAGRQYRLANLHYVVDLVTNTQNQTVLEQVIGSLSRVASRFAGALLFCTTDFRLAKVMKQSGWLSAKSPLIGRRLGEKAPVYMLSGQLADFDGDAVSLNFTDSDVDFNI